MKKMLSYQAKLICLVNIAVRDTEPKDRLPDVFVLRGKRKGLATGNRGCRGSSAIGKSVRRSRERGRSIRVRGVRVVTVR